MFKLILLCGLVQAPVAAPSPADEFARFLKDWDGAAAEMTRTREAVQGDEQLQTWNADNQRRTHNFGNRALDLAARYPRTPEAVDALTWVTSWGYSPETNRALAVLRRDYPTSPRLARACDDTRRVVLGAFEEAEAFPQAVLEANPDRAVRGRACFALATYHQWYAEALPVWAEHPEYLPERGLGNERVKQLQARDAGEQARLAIELFERVRVEFADVPDRRGRLLGTRAEGELTELRDLKAGRVAPAIIGRDVDGREFRLADLRGKVVVLTFSGNWCGPCRAAYPHERGLVKRLAGRPFVLVSLNTDEDPQTLRRAIDSGEITWRCWSEAGTDGPIVRAWGVSQFPTLYVLDASGVIRHKDIAGAELDRAVDVLLSGGKPAP